MAGHPGAPRCPAGAPAACWWGGGGRCSAERRARDLGAEELALLLPVGAPPPAGPEDRADGHAGEGLLRLDGDAEGVPPEGAATGMAPALQDDTEQPPAVPDVELD